MYLFVSIPVEVGLIRQLFTSLVQKFARANAENGFFGVLILICGQLLSNYGLIFENVNVERGYLPMVN